MSDPVSPVPTSRRTCLAIVAVLVGAGALGLGCVRTIRPRDFLRPTHSSVISDSVVRQNVEIVTSDSVRLRGWRLLTPGAEDTMICFYGAGETAMKGAWRWYWFAETFRLNVLVVDYRGYGFSDGVPDLDRMFDDAVLAFDTLVDEPSRGRTFVYGFSLGVPAAVHLAARRRVDGIILQGAFGSLDEASKSWNKLIPWYARCCVRLKLDDSLRRAGDLLPFIRTMESPLLVVHGEKDELFPLENARRLLDESAANFKVWCPVPNAGHDSVDLRESPARDCVSRFLAHFPREAS